MISLEEMVVTVATTALLQLVARALALTLGCELRITHIQPLLGPDHVAGGVFGALMVEHAPVV